MCCRFYIEKTSDMISYAEEATGSLSERMTERLGKPLTIEGEVFPSYMVPVIAPDRQLHKTVFPMIWGISVQGIDRPVINARSETASKKISFKESWEKRRCIVPASWYYEWKHIEKEDGKYRTGDKYAIQPKGETATYLAGLYQLQESGGLRFPAFTILTREPSEEIRPIHDRMPLILPKSLIDDWIDPNKKPEGLLQQALTDMIYEKG